MGEIFLFSYLLLNKEYPMATLSRSSMSHVGPDAVFRFASEATLMEIRAYMAKDAQKGTFA